MKLIKGIFICMFLFFFFVSCSKSENEGKNRYKRTVIVYMCADNNLSSLAMKNIEQMKNAQIGDEDNFIVYIDAKGQLPEIIKIHNNKEEIIKTYIEHNSADTLIFETVLNDIINEYPSSSYGLILWSHGSSWLPSINLRSFASDNTNEMDIISLSNALPIKFDFILFDSCIMGGVEVAFQLRNKTRYMLVSPTEVLSSGFPYDEIMPFFFGNDLVASLSHIANLYYDYYNAQSGKNKTATISLINMEEMDKLASLNNELFTKRRLELWNYNYDKIQPLYSINSTNYLLFDYLDFLNTNFDSTLIESIKEQMNKVVLYKANTEKILDDIEIVSFSGLSCYVPQQQYNFYNQYYKKLDWCSNSGFFSLFSYE